MRVVVLTREQLEQELLEVADDDPQAEQWLLALWINDRGHWEAQKR